MRQADFVSGVVLCLLGLGMLIFVIPSQIAQAPAGFVSPRLVPNMMMIAVVGLSVLLMLKALRGTSYGPHLAKNLFSRNEVRMALRLAMVFAIAIAVFVWLSPLVAGVVLIVGTLLALGERGPVVLVVMPATLLLGVWLFFYQLLGTAIL